MVMSGYYGPEIWTYRIADVVGYEWLFMDYSIRDIWIPILLGSFLLAHLPFWYSRTPSYSLYHMN